MEGGEGGMWLAGWLAGCAAYSCPPVRPVRLPLPSLFGSRPSALVRWEVGGRLVAREDSCVNALHTVPQAL
ncbi:hypothetical protein IWX49DRAFT_579466 [Phyllosticta citricarpa]